MISFHIIEELQIFPSFAKTYFNNNKSETNLFANKKSEKKTPLEIYGTDLTRLARQGQLEECFGRDKELLEMMEILVRRQKNNPVLVGDAGVGKTAIIELFATTIVNNLVPFILEGRTLISLDLTKIVSNSRYRGEFEKRFQKILNEVLSHPNVILFIDEIHNLTSTGSPEGSSTNAANILKPTLARSGFQCIGATTIKEYEKIEKDPALNRRFQPIKVKEPSIDEAIKILYAIRPSLESFHNVHILPGAITLAVDLSARYIYDRFLPDKAIDLVDRAAAKEVIRITNVTEGSVVAALANAGLNNIGKLRVEAFRRGDIASEFIFQEIENAYRIFLFRWIQSPLTLPDNLEFSGDSKLSHNLESLKNSKSSENLSPISRKLFNLMRLSILKRVDELLFSSTKLRSVTKVVKKRKDLSLEKNQNIYAKILSDISSKTFSEISIYRISLLLFGEWIEGQEFYFFTIISKEKYFINLINILHTFKIYDYLCQIRKKVQENTYINGSVDDFCETDIEVYDETFETLSELEQTQIEVFKDFLTNLKPVLKKGIIQSLKHSSEIKLSEKELSIIYNLLGYFSTETGRDFLVNLDDPDLIKRARKLGDFTSLKPCITEYEIRELLADITGIPTKSLSNVESEKLINLEATLHQRVIGQEEAISAIAKAVRRSRLGIQNPNRPIASFMFCGPTGVGKTEVTKALAVTMFGAESDMIRFDMSEFMEKFAVSRLIGSPPGYVGYEDGGQLTDTVRRKPYSVVLFDEIEKAHPDILNILLQILEDGRLTDTQKRLIPFDNTIIIMTSNAAADEIQQVLKEEGISQNEFSSEKNKEEKTFSIYEDEYSGAIKFLKSPITENFFVDIKEQLRIEFEKSFRNLKEYALLEKEVKKENISKKDKNSEEIIGKSKLKDVVLERLSTMFLPEFLNRLDDIIIFQPLHPEELRKICDIMIEEVSKRVKLKNIILRIDNKVKVKLTHEGYSPLFGARPLRRLITKHIEDLISENMLKSPINNKEKIIQIVLNEDDQILIKENEVL